MTKEELLKKVKIADTAFLTVTLKNGRKFRVLPNTVSEETAIIAECYDEANDFDRTAPFVVLQPEDIDNISETA